MSRMGSLCFESTLLHRKLITEKLFWSTSSNLRWTLFFSFLPQMMRNYEKEFYIFDILKQTLAFFSSWAPIATTILVDPAAALFISSYWRCRFLNTVVALSWRRISLLFVFVMWHHICVHVYIYVLFLIQWGGVRFPPHARMEVVVAGLNGSTHVGDGVALVVERSYLRVQLRASGRLSNMHNYMPRSLLS